MRQIEIEWVQTGITITADLSEERNPGLADLLWNELLPYNSLQNHALVSGKHLYHLVPHHQLVYLEAEYKEDRTQSPDGTVFLSQLQHLAVKYGPLTEYIPAAPVGQVIPEHIEALRKAGRVCWEAAWESKQVIEVRVRRKGEPATEFTLPRILPIGSPGVQKLVDEIYDEIERVWIDPPTEIVDMHQGRITSRAGSYDQYFSTLVFLNGEVRPLGYCALNGLLKVCRTTNIDVAELKRIAPIFIKTPSEFLGYTGLNTLWRFTQQVLAVLPEVETKEHYFALINSLALYVNVLNTWNLHYFPWQHGAHYGYSQT
jgi:Cucumopine synthase C-terminal helical bundle domain